MRIKMKIGVSGTFHNIEAGVKVGDVVDIEDAEAERYIKLGYAEAAQSRSVEHAVSPSSNEELATLSTEVVGASEKAVPQPKAPRPPAVEPEPEPGPVEKTETVTAKPGARSPGPRKPK